jgi:hypothetical protein
MGKEPLRGSDITPFAQEKINGSTLFIDRATQVKPLALCLNVGLVHAGSRPQAARYWFPSFSKSGTYRCAHRKMVV